MNRQQVGFGRHVLSVLWALMPLYTFGLLAPVPFIHVAVRRRTLKASVIAAAYVVVLVIALASVSLLILALMLVGTIHAFQLRSSVFALPAGHREPQPFAGPAPVYQDSRFSQPESAPRPHGPDAVAVTCARLRAEMGRLTSYVRTHPGALPPACEQSIYEISQHCERVIASADHDHRAGSELRSVDAIVSEYLPEAVSAYTRLPGDFATTQVNADARTPAGELEIQLELMRDAAKEAVESLARGDATRLHMQSAFLREKFHKSELDL